MVESSEDILGLKKDTFYEIVKIGAIAGAVAGVITYIAGFVSTMAFWGGALMMYGGYGLGFNFGALFQGVIQQAISGAILAVVVVKFYDKFPFKTLFMKMFGISLIVNVVLGGLFAAVFSIFGAGLSFIVLMVGLIIANYVEAKMIADKVGPLTNLK
ncbi:MAG: hypothetical protein Q7S92_06415 [Candidatus Diapherotrites archaeon]|nr:hypothetical protein [Candidatus Diapherotrites archaeon]